MGFDDLNDPRLFWTLDGADVGVQVTLIRDGMIQQMYGGLDGDDGCGYDLQDLATGYRSLMLQARADTDSNIAPSERFLIVWRDNYQLSVATSLEEMLDLLQEHYCIFDPDEPDDADQD